MASQTPTAQKSSSRWGSFLAGVESRLDTILADEETAKKASDARGGSKQELPGRKDGTAEPSAAKPGLSRTASANRTQDRLNEKLARAMANKTLARKGDASTTTSGVPSRTASPVNVTTSPRASSDQVRENGNAPEVKADQSMTSDEPAMTDGINTGEGVEHATSKANPFDIGSIAETPAIAIEEVKDEINDARPSTESRGSVSTRQSLELTRATTPSTSESPKSDGIAVGSGLKMPEECEKVIDQMRSDHEAAELRRQEETHTYLEQIDALQSKLQYLTKEAAEIAKNASGNAKPGSLEQKVAAKEEKIALLIEEGQKLSQTELKHMSIIKRLRAKGTEDEKLVADSKRLLEKHEKAAREAQERAKRAETAEKRAFERIKSLSKVETDLQTARADCEAKDSLIIDLQMQLSQVTSAAKEAESRANEQALEAERRRLVDLAEELSSVKTEKELAEKQYQTELRDLQGKAERDRERARVAEIERQGEQNILESRLEVYRTRAEEASAGQGGDVQAKLLRQIETLQNQYAVASENWQGIEGSLLSRVMTLEKERDDVTKREADMRRKARETNTKARRMEEELERANARTQDTDQELSSRTTQLATLQERLARSEAEIDALRHDLRAERESWEVRLAQKLEDEKIRIREETARSTPDIYQQFRNDSPITYTRTRKSSNPDRNSPHGRRTQGLAISGAGNFPLERPVSRRSSNQPLHTLQSIESQAHRHVSRKDSMSTVPQASISNGIPDTPSVIDKDDDFFAGLHTPATPDRTINDLISVSTAAAGPSVQLVERMSAAVRRLESEKAAHKDELNRLSSQRDEFREQVVSLMKEAEEKRAWERRVKEMEGSLKEVEDRYLTTLEMLGEKSEMVEELKADVQDLKGMYRELVESTMK